MTIAQSKPIRAYAILSAVGGLTVWTVHQATFLALVLLCRFIPTLTQNCLYTNTHRRVIAHHALEKSVQIYQYRSGGVVCANRLCSACRLHRVS